MTDFVSAFPDAEIIRALGEPVTLPDGRTVSGVFDCEAADGTLGSLPMDYRRPELTLTDEDATGLTRGDRLTIRQRVFTVEDPLPDGAGVTVITLAEEQPDPSSGRWK